MQILSGKTAVVTGASSGIGWATARDLAAAGAHVVASARREDKLRQLAAECPPGSITVVPSDASKPADIDKLVATAREVGKGRLNIVIANAGHGLAGGLMGSDRSRWEEMFQLNVIGASHLMRQAAGVMIEQKSGDIVAIGSVVGVNISPFSAYYGATKFAIVSLAEALRREICQHKVRVSVIKPATVVSEFQQVAGYTEDGFFKNAAKWGELLKPDDVARVITFIVSQPAHVHVNDLMIRPVGQDYP